MGENRNGLRHEDIKIRESEKEICREDRIDERREKRNVLTD